jgi:hypothetical protein
VAAPTIAANCGRTPASRWKRGASILNDSQRQVVVAPGLEQCYRAFEMLLRFEEFSGEPVGDALHAMRDTDFGRNGSRLNVPSTAAACALVRDNSPRS